MTDAERAQSFVCTPLHGTITRGACAERHLRWKRARNPTGPLTGGAGVTGCACRRCPIGKEHARGRVVPNVQLVQVRMHGGSDGKRVSHCSGCGQPMPTSQPKRGRAPSTCSDACAAAVSEFVQRSSDEQLLEWA